MDTIACLIVHLHYPHKNGVDQSLYFIVLPVHEKLIDTISVFCHFFWDKISNRGSEKTEN
ncbi:hypothetical protein SAMN04488072_104127 [Lentibacillus halodurans]|uniref:Uncharacterized protein n=1 Tax=Lentibacillus halodurans TaxID=237679 RepID=A0A1I0X3S2_9BACI|nr:hypothetical protein SAMN04488072_104127 [Lentibacillus halodurans]